MSIFQKQDTCCSPRDTVPQRPANRPGLSAIRYRLGTHALFKHAMLRTLSRTPALSGLTTRDDSDTGIALIDCWATVLDVLTFYQERIANEGFLLPATERRSVLELARAIGYELNPGVAAGVDLVFTVEKVPGAMDEVVLDAGLKVQSIPGQDETPQTFETTETLAALPVLNELRPRLNRPHDFARATTRIHLQGIDTRLEPGDLILMTGPSRENNPFSERWDVRTVNDVVVDTEAGHTAVGWSHDLGHENPWVDPAESPGVYVFRERASLFGHNAPDWRLMSENIKNEFDPQGSQRSQWPDFEIQTVNDHRIDLDTVYESLIGGSWVLLDRPGYRELYRAEEVFTDSRTDYSLTAKTTSLILDTNRHLSWFPLRDTTVFACSEALPLAGDPIELPVFGDRIELDGHYPEIAEGRRLVFRGTPVTRMVVADRTHRFRTGDEVETGQPPPLVLAPDDGGAAVTLDTGDVLTLTAAPEPGPAGSIVWHLATGIGITGWVQAGEDDLLVVDDNGRNAPAFAPADDSGDAAEVAFVRAIEGDDRHTVLVLEASLTHTYHRQRLRVHANVVAATHGETRAEIVAQLTGSARSETVGSGNSAVAMQSFTLTQTPLTYTQAATASGGESSLRMRVDGLAWTEVPSLFGRAGDARVYATRRNHLHQTVVMFGDGSHGARLPTGRDNVAATYRIGTGAAGNVRRHQLQLLMSRPLGAKSVDNPLAAESGQDPEDLDAARANAPLTVLTLERVVSVQDFEDFARAFTGIGKARATVLWNGERQIVHLTVAGTGATPVAPGAALIGNLRTAIDIARHRDQAVVVDPHVEQRFGLSLTLVVARGHDRTTVETAVRGALSTQYSFQRRDFAQSVSASEISALVQAVDGVEAAILTRLDGRDPIDHPTLAAAPAHWDSSHSSIVPALLLLLDTDATILETVES